MLIRKTSKPVPERSTPEGDHQLRRRMHALIEPPALIAGVTVILLVAFWAATWQVIAHERERARQEAAEAVPEMAATYEARILRALRRIQTTLELVGHSLDGTSASGVLENLRSENLLPESLIFRVTILDETGQVVASTANGGGQQASPGTNVRTLLNKEGMVISEPWRNPETGEWRLSFGRGVDELNDATSGAVVVSVPAYYFVSDYDSESMGEDGVLALVGTDGVTRVRRNGENITAGSRVATDALLANDPGPDGHAPNRVTPWQGTEHYVSARKLFGYPLAVIVGVSRPEQMQPAAERGNHYVMRAAVASLGIVLVMATWMYLSRQLQKARARVFEERMAHAREVEYMAFHDDLTGLANRGFFTHLLGQAVQQAQRYEHKLAVVFLDMDGFKSINDSLGHDAGDELLREAASRLNANLRGSDLVARIGGDEFVIFLPEVGDREGAAVVAQRVLAALASPFILRQSLCRVSVSMGVALFPEDGESEQDLLKSADQAMFRAKEAGKNGFRFASDGAIADDNRQHSDEGKPGAGAPENAVGKSGST